MTGQVHGLHESDCTQVWNCCAACTLGLPGHPAGRKWQFTSTWL